VIGGSALRLSVFSSFPLTFFFPGDPEVLGGFRLDGFPVACVALVCALRMVPFPAAVPRADLRDGVSFVCDVCQLFAASPVSSFSPSWFPPVGFFVGR